jgi:hypothetical protein
LPQSAICPLEIFRSLSILLLPRYSNSHYKKCHVFPAICSLERPSQLFYQFLYRVPGRSATQGASGRPKRAHVRTDANDVQASTTRSLPRDKRRVRKASQKDGGRFSKRQETIHKHRRWSLGACPTTTCPTSGVENLLTSEKGHKWAPFHMRTTRLVRGNGREIGMKVLAICPL